MFRSPPRIVDCISKNFSTEVSLTHHPILKSIILVMAHPVEEDKTLIKIFSDKSPFDIKQEFATDFEVYNATVSLDRRSIED